MNTNESGETIEEREAHIIALARIVGTPQGERKPSAIYVAIRWNRDKSNLWVTWPCGHSSEEGDTTWNAHLQGWGALRLEAGVSRVPARPDRGWRGHPRPPERP